MRLDVVGTEAVRPPRKTKWRTPLIGLRGRRRTALVGLAPYLLLAFAGLATELAQAQTTTLVSNTGQTYDSSVTWAVGPSGSAHFTRSQAFTTGSNSGGYTVSQIEIDIKSASSSDQVRVTIYSSDSNDGTPDTLQHTLSNPTSYTDGLNAFAATGVTLSASTTYHVVVEGLAGAFSSRVVSGNDEDSDKAAGWSIDNDHQWRNSDTGSWSTNAASLRMKISGCVGPCTTISTDATLSDLTLEDASDDSTIAISPAFVSTTTTYTASVANGVDQVTVAATVSDDGAGVEYLDGNDAALTDADGTKAGFQVDLDVGGNVIKAEVTAEDGNTVETYELRVTRDGDRLVSNWSGAGASVGVQQSASRATGFTTGAETADLLTVDLRFNDLDEGGEQMTVSVYSSSASGTPDSLIGTLSTPAFDATSGNNAVRNLTFTADTPIGLSANTDYIVVVTSDSGRFEVAVVTSDAETSDSRPGWSIADNGLSRSTPTGSWISRSSETRMTLTGTNIVAVASTDATLSDLTLEDSSDDSTIGISPTFASGTTTYTASVANGVDQVTVEATVNDSNAGVEYLDGNDAALTDADGPKGGFQVDLDVGANVIKAKVTAEDNSTTSTYQVTVTRAASMSSSDVLVSNTGQADAQLGSLSSFDHAQAFTTGGNADGYLLTSVDIKFATLAFTSTTYAVSIFSSKSSTLTGDVEPDSRLTGSSLTGPASLTANGLNTYTASGSGVALAKDTTYFILIDSSSTNANNLRNTDSDNEDGTPAAGWSIADGSLYRNRGGGSWTYFAESKMIAIKGSVVDSAVSTDATLSDLTLEDASDDSAIEISPTFASTTTSYTASVANGVTQVTVEATTNDSNASVEYQDSGGTALTDADTTKTGFQVDLIVGDTVIKAEVTAEDGNTTETYQVTVTRAAAPADCTDDHQAIWCATVTVGNVTSATFTVGYGYASGSVTSGGSLSDTEFDYDGTTYDVTVLYLSTDTNPTLRLALDPAGVTVFNKANFTLHAGDEEFSLDDATTTATLFQWSMSGLSWSAGDMIAVKLTDSSITSTDATLSDLTLKDASDDSSIMLSPGFASTTTSYTASVGSGVTQVTVEATLNDENADVEFQDSGGTALTDADDMKDGFQVDLAEGDNVIQAEVTAEDDSTIETYQVTVTRACADPEALWCATLTVGRLELGGLHFGDGFDDLGGMLTDTAFDHDGTTYDVTVLSVFSGTLSFALNPAGLTVFNKPQFRLHVGDDAFSLGDAATNLGSFNWANSGVSWSVGATVAVKLTEVALSTDATLSDLTLEDAADDSTIGIGPAFVSGTTSYTASVAHGATRVTVEATTTDDGADVEYLDGSDAALTDADGVKDGFQVDLGVGDNVIKAKVTAEDGIAIETYELTVTRACAEPVAVWCTTLTVAEILDGSNVTGHGYLEDPQGIQTVYYGSVLANTFEREGTQYRVKGLFIDAGAGSTMKFKLSPIDAGVFLNRRFALHVDDDSFSFADATTNTVGYQWTNTGLSWAAADTYDVMITEVPASTDATLSDLTLEDASDDSSIEIGPTFASGTTGYTASVAHGATRVTVEGTATDDGADVQYLDGNDASLTDADGVKDGFQVDLSVGANVIKAKVTAEDAIATVTYQVTVTRSAAPTGRVLVSNLGQTSDGTSSVGKSATVQIGRAVKFTTGPNSGGFDLAEVQVAIRGIAGSTLAGAQPVVTIREPDATDPDNPSATVLYTMTGPAALPAGDVSFTAPANATLAGNSDYFIVIVNFSIDADKQFAILNTDADAEDSSGLTGWSIANVGRSHVGTSWGADSHGRTYLISVRGAAIASTDATLSDLTLKDASDDSAIAVDPAFASDTTSYIAFVANGVSQVTVEATVNDSNASVEYLDGNDAALTDADGAKGGFQADLALGVNVIKAKVTAEDGIATATYLVLVTRNTPATGAPTVTGAPQAGQTLTAGPGDVSDVDGLPGGTFPAGYTFQWLRVDESQTPVQETPIAGATGRTYTLAAADVGNRVKVRVSFTDRGGESEARTSDAFPSSGSILAQGANSPPAFAAASYTRTLAETIGAAAAQAAANLGAPIAATDADGDPIAYSLEGTGASKFAVNASSGQISTKAGERYDYEEAAMYSLSLKAEDDNGGSSVTAVRIDIVDNTGERPLKMDPPAVQATADSFTSLDVSWTAPDNTGRPPIAGYDLRYRVAGGAWSDGPQDVSGTQASISGLAEDTAYEVQVRAGNADGEGPWSDAGSGRTGVQGAVAVSFSSERYTAREGAGRAEVTVRLAEARDRVIVIPLVVERLGGASAADHSAVPASVTFAALQTSKSFEITAVDDAEDDDGESLKLSFGTLPSKVTAGMPAMATVQLADNDGDDAAAITIRFDMESTYVREGLGAATLGAVLNQPPGEALDIPLLLTRGGGAVAADHGAVPGVLSFAADKTRAEFSVVATEDDVDDDGEYLEFAFGTLPAGVSRAEPSTARVNLIDEQGEDIRVSFAASEAGQTEGNGVRVSLTLSAPAPSDVAIPLAVEHRGGASAADYSGLPSSVTFAAGSSSTSFDIDILADDQDDDGESLVVSLGTLPAGYASGYRPQVVVTLHDADGRQEWAVWFGKADYTAAEGGGAVTVTVELDAPWKPWLNEPLVLGIGAEYLGGATSADHSALPGRVTVLRGETEVSFTVAAVDDALDDDGESIRLSFANPFPDDLTVRGGPGSAVVHLQDNDGVIEVSVAFGESVYTAEEGGQDATVTLSLDRAPGRQVEIPLRVAHEAGARADDYAGVPASAVFGAADVTQSFTVTATDDAEAEYEERIELRLGALPAGVSAGSPARASVNLVDDDGDPVPREVYFGGHGNPTSHVAEGRGFFIDLYIDPPVVEGSLSVPLTVTPLGGISEADYEGMPDVVTFSDGERRSGFAIDAVDDAEVDPDEGLRIEFGALPAGVSVAANRSSSRTLMIKDNDGPVKLSVSDASAREPPNHHSKTYLVFEVTTDRWHEEEVRVDYRTVDGTAAAPADYEARTGTLVFRRGETSKKVGVTVTDDDHDEGTETMTLRLSSPVNAIIDDGIGEGSIRNTDKMPNSWLSRFGRTASMHVLESIEERLDGGPQQNRLIVGGQRVQGGLATGWLERLREPAEGEAPVPPAFAEEGAWARMDRLSAGLAGGSPGPAGGSPGLADGSLAGGNSADGSAGLAGGVPAGAAPGSAGGGGQARQMLKRALGIPELPDGLMGSSFFYSSAARRGGDGGAAAPEADRFGQWSAWGRTAVTRFGGADGPVSINGEVATATLGVDTQKGRWLTGLVLARSEGEGAYRGRSSSGGTVASTITSLNPFARYRLNERTRVWGTLGYGTGELVLAPRRSGERLETDLTTMTAAFGGRGVLSVRNGEDRAFQLAIRSDALWTSTESDTITGLAGAAGATSRVRVLLEGKGTLPVAAGGALVPTLEAGLRYDGGDAETGAGLEFGAGLGYTAGRFAVELDVRGLVAHEDTEYEEWGFSGMVRYQPNPDGRGLSVDLGSAWGATQSGVQSMWTRETADGLARGSAMNAAQRFQAALGYGFEGRRGSALWTPFLAAESAGGGSQALRTGVRLTAGTNAEVGLELRRSESLGGEPDHGWQLGGQIRW